MAVFFLPLFFLCVSGQELLQILSLHQHDSTTEPLQMSLGVTVHQEKLNEVSTSVLMAEKWLRAHVLSIYPSTNVNSIVVSNKLLCDENGFGNHEEISGFTVAAMENIHHSLVRWGLEKKIKVSVFITSKCLQNSYLKPVFAFLEEMNSTCTMKLPDFSDETFGILSSQLTSLADLGVFRSKTLNILSSVSKPTSRKLSFIDPVSVVGYSVPSDAATTPLPPLIGITSPPPLTPPLAPEMQPPMTSPMYSSPPHYGVNLPPCNPHPRGRHGGGAMAAPPPLVGSGGSTAAPPFSNEGVWCVAKPSVPSEKLQEAMDYACGEGGADCEAISPTGSCYFPDSIVAHASYAFNSYWQKNKNNGGTCGFGGTAMLINSDPSFLQCHFTLE
ncbi:glucan endo-1,3-beta-glucosidase 1 [Cynara cardunculus var. scolymus]|uniref:glucan endo-1,3-beta-glucosidase 1 n=1 Tax=Cynara cardunculus var. scolymus TaxID=59895 RepID=UPI000D62A268|nr:glucan endo-1,3-beta-glucosidase 1 [Cynara cardunculus var. scolymus]